MYRFISLIALSLFIGGCSLCNDEPTSTKDRTSAAFPGSYASRADSSTTWNFIASEDSTAKLTITEGDSVIELEYEVIEDSTYVSEIEE
ncbi:MAG: hypothetical protein M0P13_03360 [Fibrobacteraceae bacterium]|nr:hypothetical protein [Fibrobacteraceae bacterium]